MFFKQFSSPSSSTLEPEQANFHHLVMDIAWFGIALPATARFLSMYAIRLGASASQLAWIASGPALILLVSAALSGWWRSRYPSSVQAVHWPALWFRLVFLLPAFTPFLPREWQIYWLIFSVVAPALPQGVGSVLFLVMMREAVQKSQLMRLLSRRAFAMNLTVAASGIALGFWLDSAPFPANYQVMFVMAFGLALVSLWHVDQTRPIYVEPMEVKTEKAIRPFATAGFQRVSVVVMLTHIAFFSVVPLVPLYLVEQHDASEFFIGIFALFELAAGALASLYIDRISKWLGNQMMIALAMVATCVASLIIAVAPQLWMILLSAWIGGAAWTLAGNGIFGFFSDNTPAADLTRYTTVYSQTIYLAIFIGPLVGSLMVTQGIELGPIILIGGAMRLVAGALIWLDPVDRLHARPLQHVWRLRI